MLLMKPVAEDDFAGRALFLTGISIRQTSASSLQISPHNPCRHESGERPLGLLLSGIGGLRTGISFQGQDSFN